MRTWHRSATACTRCPEVSSTFSRAVSSGAAAYGALVKDADTGRVLAEEGTTIGVASNNVAEYRALLLGLARARALGATEVEVVNDSELVAKQVNGAYKVKHAAMKPLHAQALEALADFERWEVRTVRREANAHADRLVNEALDGVR